MIPFTKQWRSMIMTCFFLDMTYRLLLPGAQPSADWRILTLRPPPPPPPHFSSEALLLFFQS